MRLEKFDKDDIIYEQGLLSLTTFNNLTFSESIGTKFFLIIQGSVGLYIDNKDS